MRNRLHYIPLTEKGNKKIYKNVKYPSIPFDREDLYVTTVYGDRLDLLANQFYNDVRLWWVIATANRGLIRRDSYALEPGLDIRIPANINKILSDFELINQNR